MAAELRSRLALLALWVAASLPNLTKAVHVDDPTHLLIARHILEDPLHPMSGTVVLSGTAHPISSLNQPALLYYGFAAVMAAFGASELALHVFLALFTGVAIVGFHALARCVCPAYALPLTLAFCLGPAFLPAQGLMADVPLLALWILFFWVLTSRVDAVEGPARGRWYAVAALLAGAACLVKYTSLVLLPLLLLPIVVRRDWTRAAVLLIPVLVLAAWSGFNLFDYGEVHILGRGAGLPSLADLGARLADFVLCLGAISPFSILLVPWALRRRREALGVALAVAVALLLHAWALEPAPLQPLLGRVFFANGVLVLLAAALSLRSAPLQQGLLLAGWIAATAGFIVSLAPFMAVRHVLLVVPPLLLALGRLIPPVRAARVWLGVACAASAALGVALAVSDWVFADLYRSQARVLRERFGPDARLWYLGNWGWRWYAELEGMQPYLPGRSRLRPGDLLVIPEIPTGPKAVHPRDEGRIAPAYEFTVDSTLATRLRTISRQPLGGYYAFASPGLPWSVSRAPLERFHILRVSEP